jgi:hypothetical protein
MRKEAIPKNAKGLIQKTSDETRGNPKKRKESYSKRSLMKKVATPKNTEGLIK